MKAFKVFLATCFTTLLIFAGNSFASEKVEKPNSIINIPAYILMQGMKRIAVLDFEGYEQEFAGQGISSALIVKLQGSGRFDVLEREQLTKVLKENALGMTGLVDPQTTKHMGQILGTDGLVLGKVLSWTAESNDVVAGNKTKEYRQAYVKVIIKIANVESGEIKTVGTFEKRITQSEASDYTKLRTKQELLQLCATDITNQFMETLVEPVAKVSTHKAKPLVKDFYIGKSKYFQEASKGYKRQLWPETKENIDNALTESQEKKNQKDEAGAHYDLGLYYDGQPNYSSSEKEYRSAYDLDQKDLYLDCLSEARIKRFKFQTNYETPA